MRNGWKKALAITLALLVMLGGGVWLYAADCYRATAAAVTAAGRGDPQGGLTVFAGNNEVGLVFYPGGKVEAAAYAPLLAALCEEGITCVLAEMPLNLAVLKADAWKEAKAAVPEVTHWVIAGHSLGGAMASTAPATEFEALILLAAYPTAPVSMSVLSLYGSEDGVMDRKKYEAARPYMPAIFVETVLEGGNHAYFGCYGEQKGDGKATLTVEQQQAMTKEAIVQFIKENVL